MSEKKMVSLEPWDPFRELDVFRGWPSMRLLGGSDWGGRPAAARWSPSMDVTENETHFIATVELPGTRKEDVHVEVAGGVLTIRGEKRSESAQENEQRRVTERCYGSFCRSFTLPSNANEDDIKASFSEGVLRVEIGKRSQTETKAIAVD